MFGDFIKGIFKPQDKGVNFANYDGNGLIDEFYQRLQNFDTTLSDSNLFFVQYVLPGFLSDNYYKYIGESPNDGRTGITTVKNTFNSTILQSITNSVDIPDDSHKMQRIPDNSYVNGFLPITTSSSREIDTTGLKIGFFDTNLSLNDLVFKPWIRLVAREGCFTNFLYTNINVIFLGRKHNRDNTVVRKKYTFYDCVPFDSENKDVAKYKESPSVIEHRVRFKFNRYDIQLTKL